MEIPKEARWLAAILAVFCAIGIATLPYGYYQFLRLAVCGGSVFLAFGLWEDQRAWAWTMIAVALLFNPIAKIHFEKEQWQVIDGVVAVFLFAFAAIVGRTNNP